MINLMQIRSIAASVVKVQLKRVGRALDSATEQEVDEMYMTVMEIFANKEKIMSSLSEGRGEYPTPISK